jgi:phenylacetate-CoA ligase
MGLEASQWLQTHELADRQRGQLAIVTAHHRKHSDFFSERSRCMPIDAPIEAFPVLRRSDIQGAGETFFAKEIPHGRSRSSEGKTSGSTGQPVVMRTCLINSLFLSAYEVRSNAWWDRDLTNRLTAIKPTFERYSEGRCHGVHAAGLYETGEMQRIPITFDIKQQLHLMQRFGTETLIVYPTNLAEFLLAWTRDGFDLTGMKHIRTIGETVSDSLRERTRAITGLGIEDCYSSTEVGPIAIQCPHSGLYHIMAETIIAEVVDDAGLPCHEGKIGRVLITDLVNFASPIFRYDIGDYAEVGPPCPCGRGLPTLRRIVGRERNMLLHADGRRNWPVIGYHQFSNVVPVKQFQAVQRTISNIELTIVTDAAVGEKKSSEIVEIMKCCMGNDFNFTIKRQVDYIQTSGKFEEFVRAF